MKKSIISHIFKGFIENEQKIVGLTEKHSVLSMHSTSKNKLFLDLISLLMYIKIRTLYLAASQRRKTYVPSVLLHRQNQSKIQELENE